MSFRKLNMSRDIRKSQKYYNSKQNFTLKHLGELIDKTGLSKTNGLFVPTIPFFSIKDKMYRSKRKKMLAVISD